MKRVCLHMIVKNEAANIERCLRSMLGSIDTYLICDTGSTDGTPGLITSFFDNAGIPGDVAHTTFRNFGQARNDALTELRRFAGQFDYVLLCDADMELRVIRPSWRDELGKPFYAVMQRSADGALEYHNTRLFERELPVHYVGVTHEYLATGRAEDGGLFTGISYIDHASGANRGGKFDRDIQMLLQGLADEPDNPRYVFYLAKSYFDKGDYEQALHWHERRAAMSSGWSEEAFYSSYQAGICLHKLGRESEMIARHLTTFDTYPHRAEPLFVLATYYQRKRQNRLAYHLAKIGSEIAMPTQALFVEPGVYSWQLLDVMAVGLYYMNRKPEARVINERLIQIVPEATKARIRENLRFCNQ
jgi:glycosyltransferase involved in cell wall biosynthesis